MRRSHRSRGAGAAFVIALVLGLGACGSSGDSTGGAPSKPAPNNSLELTKYLPSDSRLIVAVDLEAAATELGLPADNDPFQFATANAKLDDPVTRLSFIANSAFGPLEQAFEQQKLNPIVDAIDGTAVSEEATNLLALDDPVSVLRTSQPFGEIAGALEKAGFARRGNSLEAAKPKPNEYTSLASAGDGIIVVAGNKADAAKLASTPPGGSKPIAQLLKPANLPVALAIAGPEQSCVNSLGGWSDTGGAGTLSLSVDGSADEGALNLDALQGSAIEPGTPKAEAGTIEVPFTQGSDASLQSASPVQSVVLNVAPDKLYDCG